MPNSAIYRHLRFTEHFFHNYVFSYPSNYFLAIVLMGNIFLNKDAAWCEASSNDKL